MAGHGKKRHLKRQNMPVVTGVARKGALWVEKPSSGKHPKRSALTVLALLRDKLKLVESARQAKKILNSGEILVDGIKPQSLSIPIGLMDIVSFPKLGKTYRVVITKGVLSLKEIPADQGNTKYCRVNRKTIVKKGRVQLNLHDARNVLIEKEEDRFATGDTLLLSIPKQEIKGFLKMEKGAKCLVFQGKHAGEVGELEEILGRAGSMSSNARIKVGSGKSVITLKDYLIVIDKDFQN